MPEHNALTSLAEGLDVAAYTDVQHYRQELDTIWSRNWIYVCHSSTLDEPLSYRALSVGRFNFLVLRDGSGALRGYHNACRHRGSLLVTEPEGRLTSRLLVCPYHQWAYAPEDGRLVKTSSPVKTQDFDRGAYSLVPVALREWRGCIFVHPDANAPWDVQALFQRAADGLARFPLEDMQVGHSWRTTLQCNWKTFWENFNECLHCPNIHPELSDLVPLYKRRIINRTDTPDWPDHEADTDPAYRGGLRAGAETWSGDGSAQGHVIASLSDADLARGQLYASAWPSVFVGGYADHVRVVRILPLGTDRIELHAEWLFEPQVLADPAYDISNVVEFACMVMEQDGAICEVNQRGLEGAPFEKTVLMPEEYLLKRFHDWVRAGLADTGGAESLRA